MGGESAGFPGVEAGARDGDSDGKGEEEEEGSAEGGAPLVIAESLGQGVRQSAVRVWRTLAARGVLSSALAGGT